MTDAFANVGPGDPLPTSARLWNAIIERVRTPETRDPRTRETPPRHFTVAKIKSETGEPLAQYQPAILTEPIGTTPETQAEWYASGTPLWNARPAAGLPANLRRHLSRVVVPLAPISGNEITDAVAIGTFPATVKLTAEAPLTRYLRPITDQTAGPAYWQGLEPTFEGQQLAAVAEIVWLDYAAALAGNPAAAILRMPGRPPAIHLADKNPTLTLTTINSTAWTKLPATWSTPTTNGTRANLASSGGIELRGAQSYQIRAWGDWQCTIPLSGTGTDVATGSGVTSAAKFFALGAVNLQIGIAASEPTNTGESITAATTSPLQAVQLNGSPSSLNYSGQWYYERAVTFGTLDQQTPRTLYAWARLASSANNASGKASAALAISLYDEAIFNAHGTPP